MIPLSVKVSPMTLYEIQFELLLPYVTFVVCALIALQLDRFAIALTSIACVLVLLLGYGFWLLSNSGGGYEALGIVIDLITTLAMGFFGGVWGVVILLATKNRWARPLLGGVQVILAVLPALAFYAFNLV